MKISKETFEAEISLCRHMYKEKADCAWGKCENCGVVPLLHKLYKGVIVEDKNDVVQLKEKILNS